MVSPWGGQGKDQLERRVKSIGFYLFIVVYVINFQEQECFQEELRKAQRKLLKVSRDKRWLVRWGRCVCVQNGIVKWLQARTGRDLRWFEKTYEAVLHQVRQWLGSPVLLGSSPRFQMKVFLSKHLTIGVESACKANVEPWSCNPFFWSLTAAW